MPRKNASLIAVALLLILSSPVVFAQGNFFELEQEIDKILLKKDLREAIAEAERSSKTDLQSLHTRLILYRRAVSFEKMPPVIKQILQTVPQDKSGFNGGNTVENILKDPLFQDAETLRIYLQNSYSLSEDVFKKFTTLCQKDKSACDVNGFEGWLAQKISEHRDKEYFYESLFDYRLRWREAFGLDNAELLKQFAIDFHKNPADLDAALRYLKRFNNPQTVAEIAAKFASKQAADFHVLGERLTIEAIYLNQTEDARRAIVRTGIGFLERSLQIPFTERDKELMWKYYLSRTSIAPRIGNYEKQLRFWTKTRLAESYRRAGEAAKAQPLVEELARLDKSDIQAHDVGFLAGTVQAQTGARVVENKILSEEERRKTDARYWIERANYFRGRNESLQVLEAYHEGLKNISFMPGDTSLWQQRSALVDELARFSDDAFSKFAKRAKGEDDADLSDETRQKSALWKQTESFLRAEFQATRSNAFYSYGLLRTIDVADFKDLLSEIFNRHDDQLIKIYRELPSDSLNMNLAHDFLENETVPDAKKEDFVSRLYNVALADEPEKSLKIIGYINRDRTRFAARSIPVLHKNLALVEARLKANDLSYTQREDLEYLAEDFLPVIFSAYLKAENWKGAESFMTEKYNWSKRFSSERHEYLERLALAAAAGGDSADAVRLWKLKANLNRRDLNNLELIARNADVKEKLREFYLQMKRSEPSSPVPDEALEKLK